MVLPGPTPALLLLTISWTGKDSPAISKDTARTHLTTLSRILTTPQLIDKAIPQLITYLATLRLTPKKL
jgi:hypothetical protein